MKNEKEVLLGLYKSSRESMRAHAVLLVRQGRSIKEVAEICFVDEDTVRNCVTEWGEENEIKDAPRTGASLKLTKEIEKEIIFLVEENNPEEHGMFCSSWDCSELRIYLGQQRGVVVCNEQIRKLLKRNNFNWRKLNYKFVNADEEKRNDFLEDFKEFHDDISQTTLFLKMKWQANCIQTKVTFEQEKKNHSSKQNVRMKKLTSSGGFFDERRDFYFNK